MPQESLYPYRGQQLELPWEIETLEPMVNLRELRRFFADWRGRENPYYFNFEGWNSRMSIPKTRGGVFTYFPGKDVRMISLVGVTEVSLSKNRDELREPNILTISSPLATLVIDRIIGTGEFRALGNPAGIVSFDLPVVGLLGIEPRTSTL